MNTLTFQTITDGDIEPCRDLCNELMAFQQSKAIIAPECFDGMNFDTRMKKSWNNAQAKQVILVRDGGTPVGYVFSTIEKVADKEGPIPAWAPKSDNPVRGFYPDWPMPPKIGCLSNLYCRDAYRGLGLGSTLCEMAMNWLDSFPDVDLTWVYISNGNDAALDFYLRHGFTYSHEVFGGFIKAAYRYKSQQP